MYESMKSAVAIFVEIMSQVEDMEQYTVRVMTELTEEQREMTTAINTGETFLQFCQEHIDQVKEDKIFWSESIGTITERSKVLFNMSLVPHLEQALDASMLEIQEYLQAA